MYMSSANQAACNIQRVRNAKTRKSIFKGGACPAPNSRNYMYMSSANQAAYNIQRVRNAKTRKSIFKGGKRGTR